MNKPNIILINCDDLGYGDLGCYGSTCNKTPHINQLAREGVLLEEFYMASPVCSPSRGAMMTGCWPPRIGFGEFDGKGVLFPGQRYGLHESESTLPKLLKSAGYNTKIIGKWHCGDQPEFLPTNRGFDEYYGLPYSNDMGRQSGRDDSDRFPPLPLLKNDQVIQEQPDQRGLTERYVEEALEFIGRDRENPFFLYFAHMYVHVPLFVPRHFMEQSDNGAYGAAVECIDWTVGVLMAKLKKLNLDHNTMIIFTSDNGSRVKGEGGSNGILRGVKAETWEGGLRVPLIVRWPKNLKGGSQLKGIASSVDLLATLCAWAGVSRQPQNKVDSMNLGPWLEGAVSESPRNEMFYYFKNDLEAVRQGTWKLHFSKNGRALTELYNLDLDPGETVDRAAQYPHVVQQLQALAESMRAELGDDRLNQTGTGRRPKGEVHNAVTLTKYHPDHPYMVAMYDLADSETMAG